MSIWTLNEEKRNIKVLNEDKETDILIIGGGLTGLTTAYYLKNENVCVVDANLIGHGVTKNSTAKITYLQENIYGKIATTTSVYNAKKYLESQKYSIDELKNIITTNNIDCDFVKSPSYVIAKSEKDLNDEIRFLRKNNINIIEKNIKLNNKMYKSFYANDTYTFNPIKYLNGLYNILKESLDIYENTKILKIKRKNNKYICFTKNNKIIANKIVLACHYPYFLFPFLTPIKCSLEKSFIIVSKVSEDKNLNYITINKPTYSVRYYKENNNIYQISLGRSSDIGSNLNDCYNFKKIQDMFNINSNDIILKYTNSDIITPDHMPYIGEIKKDMYIGNGYNTWGMTNSILASNIITDCILNKDNKYIDLFNPKRLNNEIMFKIPYYIFNNVKNFINSKLKKKKTWYSKNVRFFTKKGKCLSSYIDNNNKTHTVYNLCPHLKCSLVFNETELTWDCPCHSSRFDLDGKCIKGPSNYDISYKE